MRRFALLPLLLSLGLMVGCSSSPNVYQRQYMDSTLLSATELPPQEEGTPVFDPLERGASEKDEFFISLTPVTKHHIQRTVKEHAFRNLRNASWVKKEVERRNHDLVESRSCVDFSLSFVETGGNAQDIGRYHLLLISDSGHVEWLKPIAKQAPGKRIEKSSEVYERHGKGMIVTLLGEKAVDRIPMSRLKNYYCTKKKVDLSTGFTVYVHPCFRPELPVYDLVWSTDENDKKLYASFPGAPSLQWHNLRLAENSDYVAENAP